MTLRELMARHARTTLTRLDHFGEEATYVFTNGTTRTVRCVVDRLGRVPSAPNVPQIAKLRAHVAIPVDATVGITAYTPGDKMELAMRLGAAPVTVKVTEPISTDEGMIVLEVEA